ncbi:MAG: PAS domain-containing protein [Phycisphaerae bacterium]|nr:PAS domain-containing protein [Phycisphaerae bacterium]
MAFDQAAWLADDEGRVVSVYGAFEQIWEHPLSELLEDPNAIAGWVHPDDRAIIERRGDEPSKEVRLIAKDGATRWISLRSVDIRDPRLPGLARLTVARDISAAKAGQLRMHAEQEAADQALRASKKHLAAATRLARLGSWSRDLRTGVSEWSDQQREILGFKTDEPIGLQEFLDRVVAEDRQHVLDVMNKSERDGHRFSLAYRLLVDGAMRHVSEVGAVDFDDVGTPARIYGISQDVTEQVRAAEALRTSEERFRITANVTNDALWDWDLTRDHISWSVGFHNLFHYTPEEVDASLSFWSDRIHPDDREEVLASLRDAIEHEGLQWRKEYRFRRADGEFVFVEDRGNVIRDEDGKVVRMVGGISDITRRKREEIDIRRTNEELELRVRERTANMESALRELDAFSYSVSHDLRAPLRAIDGFSRMLHQEHAAELAPEALEYIDLIRAGARRMGQLIDDLLAFSRLGRQPLATDQVDMGAIAQRTVDELRHEAPDRKIEVTIGPLPDCIGDGSALKQVWVNLLSNALKYSRPRDVARIEIDAVSDDPAAPGLVVYRVRDNGVGFDERYAHKLFLVFQRLHPASEFEGTGVGLAIVHRIVDRHGGRVWGRSRPDGGSEFGFTIGKTSGQELTRRIT